MSNKIKAEILILCKSRLFRWISCITLLAIGYNINSTAAVFQMPEEGGYYTYAILTLAYLIGIIEPIAIGAFLGGFDENTKMTEYKLSSQSRADWLLSKAAALIAILSVILLCFNAAGLIADVTRQTIYGSAWLVLMRFLVVLFVWILWGAISFIIALIAESPGVGFVLSMIIYYGEQYIGQFFAIPFGILWNQKSLEHHFFHADQVPFGVVQASFIDPWRSAIWLSFFLLLCCLTACIYMKNQYPQK